MTPHVPTHGLSDITIVIFCALEVEAKPIVALLQQEFSPSDVRQYGLNQSREDQNSYTFGRIGPHFIAVAHLSRSGGIDTATAMQAARNTFRNIELALVVGICGAVPEYSMDISVKSVVPVYLGDVVISTDTLLYTLGRQYDGRVQIKDKPSERLSQAPTKIQNFLHRLKRSAYETIEDKTSNRIERVFRELGNAARRRREFASESIYPGLGQDSLYETDCLHAHHNHETGSLVQCCEKFPCDDARKSTCQELGCRLKRNRFLEADANRKLEVHFVSIATGDLVMRSAKERDTLSSEYGVVAFEMEAAGAWRDNPCIIIKGVSDYADSHKADKWQQYAALAAACCMEVVLDYWVAPDPLRPTAIPGAAESSPLYQTG